VHGHRFDADPDPDQAFYFDGDPDPDPTSSYIQKLENHKKFASLRSIANLHCFFFLISVIGVKIFSIFVSVSKFSVKKYSYPHIWFKWIQLRINRPCMLIPIRIRQNDAEPNGSGVGFRFTTLAFSVHRYTVFKTYCNV
jgi:hypothetical protein